MSILKIVTTCGLLALPQLGLGAASTRLAPTHNPYLSDVGGGVVSVSAGANHSVCAVADGWVMGWGHAEYNQQGVAGAGGAGVKILVDVGVPICSDRVTVGLLCQARFVGCLWNLLWRR